MACGEPITPFDIYRMLAETSATYTHSLTATSDYVHTACHCRRCGGDHLIEKCPQVKRIEFDEAGRVKWVEFFAPGDYLPPVRREKGPLDPPYDITVTSTFTTPYDMNKARAWYEATKTYTY